MQNKTQPIMPDRLGMYLHVEAAFAQARLIETRDRNTGRSTGFQVLVTQEFLTDPGMCEIRQYLDTTHPEIEVDLHLFSTDPVAAVKRFPSLDKGSRYVVRVGGGKVFDGKWRFSNCEVMWREPEAAGQEKKTAAA